MTTEPTNVLTFDIEDWFHLVDIDAVSDVETWPRLPSLVERYTDWILETLGRQRVRATFFVLGWIADRCPALIQRIAAGEHEIASHSYWHRQVDKHGPDAMREDVRRSIDVLQQLTGRKVLGYRAPTFSITRGAEWAFDVLHELGIVYDASLFPASRAHGGYECPREIHSFSNVPSGRPMPEVPTSVWDLGVTRLPFGGGGYLRLLPAPVIRAGFKSFHRRGQPVVVYLHPRDFAVDCPRVPMPLQRRFKSYVGLRTTKSKLQMLLARYRFDTCAAALGLDPSGNPRRAGAE